jgi:hypothetical protein
MFCHPPIMFTRQGLQRLVEEMRQMPMVWENSVWDRYLGLAIERAGLHPIGMLETGEAFAENTIWPARYPDLAKAVRNGSIFIHGCKDQECFNVIMEANMARQVAVDARSLGWTVTRED